MVLGKHIEQIKAFSHAHPKVKIVAGHTYMNIERKKK
jgi:xanthine dehydrogenase iron-sulfur cluster and FAD-binding subunit A